MIKHVGLRMALSTAAGCFSFSPDLVSRGDYRLEVTDSDRCSLSTTVKAWNERLRVNTSRSGSAARFPPGTRVEVSLITPDGTVLATEQAHLHLGRVHRMKRSRPYFEAMFDVVPPPGTLIRIRHNMCPTSVGVRDGAEAAAGHFLPTRTPAASD